MEAVAAHASAVIDARQGEGVVHPGVGAMKRRVEAGDLHGIRKSHMRGCDAGEIMRLMQRSERNELLKLPDDVLI